MHILVDYRPALRARTGVGEYMHELVRAYTSAFDDTVSVFTSSWKDRPDPEVATELGARVVDRRVPVRLLNLLWHRLRWPPVERLSGAVDVVHAAHPLLIPARRAAQVITIHDLFFLDQPERTRAEIHRDYAPLAADHARRADAIITPSHHVKALATERLGISDQKIYVCPPGAPHWQALGRRPNIPLNGSILFLGTLEARKNIGMLLDAYALLIDQVHNVPRLMFAGAATPDAGEWLERMAQPPLQGHVVHFGYIPSYQRELLYAGARVVVLPSLDEGFGLPALEAMSAGVPVVVSNRGSLPEVVGDAAVIVDADDPEALAAACLRIVTDPAYAAERARAGLARARTFTWTESAETLHRAYRDALARRRERDR
jgi:glycosyltransferase involved in cell wall biosynthesis